MTTILVDYKKRSKEVGFYDHRKPYEIRKIGKEIARYKQLDGANSKEVERRFGKDANALFEKKHDDTLSRKIAHEVAERLKTERRKR